MKKEDFLEILRDYLKKDFSEDEVMDILRDYEEYFVDGIIEGKSEIDIIQSLGSPKEIANELLAESNIKSENKVKGKVESFFIEAKGKFKSRNELLKKKILSDKIYEQSIGFMRIIDGINPLDKTSIHTESYDKTLELLKMLNLSIDDIGTDKIKNINIDISDYSKKLGIDEYTLTDIVNALKNPLRDPRDDMPRPILRNDVLKIEDLAVGMKLQGTVRNVVDFGAFIDIGLKNDGLVHISKMSKEYIKHPSEVVSVSDIVDCYVDEIHMDKNKVSLSLIK